MLVGHRVKQEAIHHLLGRLIPFPNGLFWVGIERIERRIVVMGDNFKFRPCRKLPRPQRQA